METAYSGLHCCCLASHSLSQMRWVLKGCRLCWNLKTNTQVLGCFIKPAVAMEVLESGDANRKVSLFPLGDIRPGVCLSVQRNNTDITLTLQSKNGGRSSGSDQQKSFCAWETCDSITLIIGEKVSKSKTELDCAQIVWGNTLSTKNSDWRECWGGKCYKSSQWGCLLSTVAQWALLPEQKNMSDDQLTGRSA